MASPLPPLQFYVSKIVDVFEASKIQLKFCFVAKKFG
jgi:hypothetical protein